MKIPKKEQIILNNTMKIQNTENTENAETH